LREHYANFVDYVLKCIAYCTTTTNALIEFLMSIDIVAIG